ncbi:hypothetical protein ACFFLZ_17235 [Photobacterium aphoticum]|uniref:Uncharacterized protein n=1 Tax=Photobacterium aphoticum TaxID=754436 RepID=A0A0J1GMH6_9GAMM|nr:hypothetical protein [Photobacterium aphoticum]KLV00955.1 hypothetical protein ABT58_10410 [Photobacterium aphoticum]PSU58873.1 hypothetical protein C9I90_05075 [Photobacterium aphoticum]GHA58293.1 hypothetical protein GCM10007086_35270 [Photobacterium aphoticum]
MCFDDDLLTPLPLSPKGYLTFAGLMKIQPETWQRNGDLYLWHALRDGIGYRAVPKDSNEIRTLISGEFERFTGKSIDACGDVALSHYVTNNSDSDIVVNPEFWRETVITSLIQSSEAHFLRGNIDLSGIYDSVRDDIRITRTETGITIEVSVINWDGPHTPVGQWILVKELPLDCKIEAEYAKVLRSKYFKFCDYCCTYNNVGHMFDKRMCQGCASHHLGVVY